MRLSLKLTFEAILIIVSVFIAQAVTKRTGLLSEGLLIAFIFLIFGALLIFGIGVLGKYFEKELNSKKQKEA